MASEIDVRAFLADPGVPFWAKAVVREGVALDPVDFSTWIDTVAVIARQRADRALMGVRPPAALNDDKGGT